MPVTPSGRVMPVSPLCPEKQYGAICAVPGRSVTSPVQVPLYR